MFGVVSGNIEKYVIGLSNCIEVNFFGRAGILGSVHGLSLFYGRNP
jgi:hypothetical protein